MFRQRTNRPPRNSTSLWLFVALTLNVFPATAALGMSLCLIYVLVNRQHVIRLKKEDFKFIKAISQPVFYLLVMGVIVGMANQNGLYDLGKDAYFFIKVLAYFLFAFVLYKKNGIDVIVRTFVWFGVGLSAGYLATLGVYFAAGWVDVSTIDAYRWSIPYLPYDAILSIALLLAFPQRGILGRHPYFFVFLQAVAVASTMSRLSLLIVAVILLMHIKTKLKFRMGVFVSVMTGVGLLAFGLMLLEQQSENMKSDGLDSQLLFKITNVFDEMFSSEFNSEEEIRTNWRAYEALQGITKYLAGTTGNYLFGYGFGAQTDIGLEMRLGEVDRSDVPVFHNGYVYLLVKLGALGLFLYLFFLYRMFSAVRSARRKLVLKGALNSKRGEGFTIAIVFFFLICITAVFFGIFNNAVFNNIVILMMVLLMSYRNMETSMASRQGAAMFYGNGVNARA